ncbi:hypothetical protein EG240_15865 [Paenimyroides tangerinum]|uniref:Uncharacterized protein n=1 Tax=Paenimyroides tangerinum TaxID=2488728 RepID=A0A3P3VV52_9FLAO|nr:hypothetical protein [Paenimyroides tangerinum]RRJ86695.1 hypothetical protein EG240_15865 [Paenimyroides tangerinum]
MNKNKILSDFKNKLELFYRNFGSDWEIKDFSKNDNIQIMLRDYLIILEKKGVIKFLDDNKFRIIDLPSNHLDI